MDWTEETIDRLKMLWQQGLSTAEIGRQLSITKNAVVGKAHRLSLPPRPSPIRKPKIGQPAPVEMPEASGPVVEAVPSEEVARADAKDTPVAEIVPMPVREPVVAETQRVKEAPVSAPVVRPEAVRPALRSVPLEKPRRGPSCCWPLGDPGTPGFHFCGAAPIPGKPYCQEHASIAYVKLRDRRDNVA